MGDHGAIVRVFHREPMRGHRQFLSLFQQRMQQKRDFHLSPFRRYRFGQMHCSVVQAPCPCKTEVPNENTSSRERRHDDSGRGVGVGRRSLGS